MPETRPELERITRQVPVPEPAFERLLRRRDRKQRNRRIAAGVVGSALALALVAGVLGASLLRADDAQRPAATIVPQPGSLLPSGAFAFTSSVTPGARPFGSLQVYMEQTDGSVTQVTDGHQNNEAESWSPDGTQLSVQRNAPLGQDLFAVNADGSGETRLTNDPEWDGYSAFSPDGSLIAYVKNTVGGDGLYVVRPDGTGASRISPAGGNVDSWQDARRPFSWSPDGRQLVFSQNSEPTGSPTYDPLDSRLYVVNADGSHLHPLLDATGAGIADGCFTRQDYRSCGRLEQPTWSPDGTAIAFVGVDASGSEIVGRSDVYVMHADGTGLTRLTDPQSVPTNYGCGLPAWSPDSTRIAFNCGKGTAYVMNADGTGLVTVAEAFGGTWSPDGTQLGVFAHDAVWFVNADGSGGITRAADDGRSDWNAPLWRP